MYQSCYFGPNFSHNQPIFIKIWANFGINLGKFKKRSIHYQIFHFIRGYWYTRRLILLPMFCITSPDRCLHQVGLPLTQNRCKTVGYNFSHKYPILNHKQYPNSKSMDCLPLSCVPLCDRTTTTSYSNCSYTMLVKSILVEIHEVHSHCPEVVSCFDWTLNDITWTGHLRTCEDNFVLLPHIKCTNRSINNALYLMFNCK